MTSTEKEDEITKKTIVDHVRMNTKRGKEEEEEEEGRRKRREGGRDSNTSKN